MNNSPNTQKPTHEAWHTLSVEKTAQILKTDLENGLTSEEAFKRLDRYGPNVLKHSDKRSWLSILLPQFTNLIVFLLLVASVIAFFLNEIIEGFAILAVIILNAMFGFFTELKAEHARGALKKAIISNAHVVRDGKEIEISSENIVPGDLISLNAGNEVPADGRIIEAARLEIEEASLTGESSPVKKLTDSLAEKNTVVAERTNMVFLGTTVTDGHGWMIVTTTGEHTEVGKIGTMIAESDAPVTPLEIKLSKLGKSLVGIVLVLCAVVVGVGWLRGYPILNMLEIGISLAIAAIPEGLPAVVTMTLAIGMQRMSKHGALIRRLPAVETLGSTTVICTDKTGTLTKNEMTAKIYQFVDYPPIEVSGSGYEPNGEFLIEGKKININDVEPLRSTLEIGLLCSDTVIDRKTENAKVLGDPTEAALNVAAEKAKLSLTDLLKVRPRIDEIPFDSISKRMTTVHKSNNGVWVAVKGAPGTIIRSCSQIHTKEGKKSFAEDEKELFFKHNDRLASQQLRVLALAYKELPNEYDKEDLINDLTFVGLVGLMDPLRDEAKDAIARCHRAGIRTIMITGDQQATALEIAKNLSLDQNSHGKDIQVFHGKELINLDEAAWQNIVSKSSVFARVSPEHKLRIVEGLQRNGEIVAMTGDGINDAPALRKADIGIAMGIKGTEVAKKASAMIITDDNFATIVIAIEQGRIIYSNIKRFVHYLFSCNGAEILVVFVSLLLGWPLPLVALQVLWLNLITDVLPALSLALEPSSPDSMEHPPHDPKKPIFDLKLSFIVACHALILTAVTLFSFWLGMEWYGWEGDGLKHAITLSFMTLALSQSFHVFNVRSNDRSLFSDLFSNSWLWAAVTTCVLLQFAAVYLPFLQRILHTAPLSLTDWTLILCTSITPLGIIELMKLFTRSTRNKTLS